MKMINIKRTPVHADGQVVGPFEPFECSHSFAAQAARNPHLMTDDDFIRTVRQRMNRQQLQRMCKNAGLSESGDTEKLKERLLGLLNPEPASETEADSDGPSRDEILDGTVQNLRKLLSEAGLPQAGAKTELQARLLDHYDYEPLEGEDDGKDEDGSSEVEDQD